MIFQAYATTLQPSATAITVANAMKTRPCLAPLLLVYLVFSATLGVAAQTVSVTLRLDTNRVEVGGSTTLHVFAQIASSQRPSADRIFAWYVDLGNTAGSVAGFDFEKLKKISSDEDLRTSSNGVTDGANRRGIYDTFLNLTGAGRDSPVELFSVPAKGLSVGQSTLYVQAGTGVTNLNADFVVAPTGGGEPWLGGDYSAANVVLNVTAKPQPPTLAIVRSPLAPLGQRLTITFAAPSGENYFVEARSGFGSDSNWEPLPDGPHNAGVVSDTNNLPRRFYRLRQGN